MTECILDIGTCNFKPDGNYWMTYAVWIFGRHKGVVDPIIVTSLWRLSLDHLWQLWQLGTGKIV